MKFAFLAFWRGPLEKIATTETPADDLEALFEQDTMGTRIEAEEVHFWTDFDRCRLFDL